MALSQLHSHLEIISWVLELVDRVECSNYKDHLPLNKYSILGDIATNKSLHTSSLSAAAPPGAFNAARPLCVWGWAQHDLCFIAWLEVVSSAWLVVAHMCLGLVHHARPRLLSSWCLLPKDGEDGALAPGFSQVEGCCSPWRLGLGGNHLLSWPPPLPYFHLHYLFWVLGKKSQREGVQL